MSFTTGVRAVSLFIGDLGDAGLSQNTGLLVKDQTGATLWQSSNRGVNHTYGALTLTSGNGGWGFLGFTTDASEGFTYLDFSLTGNNDDNIAIDTVRFNTVPEPSALSLLAVGLGGLAMMRRRRS